MRYYSQVNKLEMRVNSVRLKLACRRQSVFVFGGSCLYIYLSFSSATRVNEKSNSSMKYTFVVYYCSPGFKILNQTDSSLSEARQF